MKSYVTPYESGNQNTTTTLDECIAFYQRLAADFPQLLRFECIGEADDGLPLYAGVVSTDGIFDPVTVRKQRRLVFFNNNGIHPGEPEGIDVCMALVRDFCVDAQMRTRLGHTVFLFIPVYNVSGCKNRNNTSRVNQLGPESFGFRGNARNLDLNRDFIKCDSLEAKAFTELFVRWSPDVMVDTHSANGADYAFAMTLIHMQPDMLGGVLGAYLIDDMVPNIYERMKKIGYPLIPYVHMLKEIPDHGIKHTLETARFSGGFAALHHTIGFLTETHMLKTFAVRYDSTRATILTILDLSSEQRERIISLRAQAQADARATQERDIHWEIDYQRPSYLEFLGYEAQFKPSLLGNYQRLSYDRSRPWARKIPFYGRCIADVKVRSPRAYLLPRQWRAVVERLRWNGVELKPLSIDTTFTGRTYHVTAAPLRSQAYEGHLFHDVIQLKSIDETFTAQAGDYYIELDQPACRYIAEALEPASHDSFFRWGFFDSILERKEHYSDYLFEDIALEMLAKEPALRKQFDTWLADNPQLRSNQQAVLDFIYAHGKAHAEPSWKTYPARLIDG
jgi:hypothetical protein